MKREFNVVIERDSEGFYVASVPELHGCHTQARSLDKLLNRIKEAIELCLEVGIFIAPSAASPVCRFYSAATEPSRSLLPFISAHNLFA